MTKRDEQNVTQFVIHVGSGRAEQFQGSREQQELIESGKAVLAEGTSPLMALLSRVVTDAVAIRNLQEEVESQKGKIDQLLANAEAGSHTPG